MSRSYSFCLPPAKLAKIPPGIGYNTPEHVYKPPGTVHILQEPVNNLQELFSPPGTVYNILEPFLSFKNWLITSKNRFITPQELIENLQNVLIQS